jgi:hypothetical protein
MGASLRLFVHGFVTSNLQNWEAPFLFGNIQSLPPRNGGSRKKRSTSHAERDGEKRSLTEGAVDDFAARCWTDLRASDRNVRATNYMAAALRRRSLAPVR